MINQDESEIVRIACNLPHGLRLSADITLAGLNSLQDPSRNRSGVSFTAQRRMRSDHYAITEVPRPIWETWHSIHHADAVCKNRCIYEVLESKPSSAASPNRKEIERVQTCCP